jgi:hypothetical protein
LKPATGSVPVKDSLTVGAATVAVVVVVLVAEGEVVEL